MRYEDKGFIRAPLCYLTVQFQGPIYTHGDSPAPLPPQGMIVQPEMHLPHPGRHGTPAHEAVLGALPPQTTPLELFTVTCAWVHPEDFSLEQPSQASP